MPAPETLHDGSLMKVVLAGRRPVSTTSVLNGTVVDGGHQVPTGAPAPAEDWNYVPRSAES